MRVAIDVVKNLTSQKLHPEEPGQPSSVALAFQPNRANMAKISNCLAGLSKVSHRHYEWDGDVFKALVLRHQSHVGNGKRYDAVAVCKFWDGEPQQPSGVITRDAAGNIRHFEGPTNHTPILTEPPPQSNQTQPDASSDTPIASTSAVQGVESTVPIEPPRNPLRTPADPLALGATVGPGLQGEPSLPKQPRWASANLFPILLEAFLRGENWGTNKRKEMVSAHALEGEKQLVNWFKNSKQKHKVAWGSQNARSVLVSTPSVIVGVGSSTVQSETAEGGTSPPTASAFVAEPIVTNVSEAVGPNATQSTASDTSPPAASTSRAEPVVTNVSETVGPNAAQSTAGDTSPPAASTLVAEPIVTNVSETVGPNVALGSNRRRTKGGGGSKKRKPVYASAQAKREAQLVDVQKKVLSRAKVEGMTKQTQVKYKYRIHQNKGSLCPVEGCSRLIIGGASGLSLSIAVAKHLRANKCSSGSNPFRLGKGGLNTLKSFKDRRRKAIQDSSVSSMKLMHAGVTNTLPIETALKNGPDAGVYKLNNGEEHRVACVPLGFACKPKKRGKRTYTQAQLSFIKWCYYEGVPGQHGGNAAKKYSSQRAQDEMCLHGTPEGAKLHPSSEYWRLTPDIAAGNKATFPVRERIDHWVFKQWFCNPTDKFANSIKSQQKRAVASIDEIVETVVDDDADDV